MPPRRRGREGENGAWPGRREKVEGILRGREIMDLVQTPVGN